MDYQKKRIKFNVNIEFEYAVEIEVKEGGDPNMAACDYFRNLWYNSIDRGPLILSAVGAHLKEVKPNDEE